MLGVTFRYRSVAEYAQIQVGGPTLQVLYLALFAMVAASSAGSARLTAGALQALQTGSALAIHKTLSVYRDIFYAGLAIDIDIVSVHFDFRFN